MQDDMGFEPFNWNVIVRGAWNRAIFTPAWIAEFLFDAGANAAIPVEVPLTERAPWRIRYEGVSIIAGSDALEIAADECKYELLDRARGYACKAIDELPRTPLIAAGFNVRYRAATGPPEIAATTECQIDHILSDTGFEILDRKIFRSVRLEPGSMNLEITLAKSGESVVSYNFHRSASDPGALKEWLRLPMERVESQVVRLLQALPGVMV